MHKSVSRLHAELHLVAREGGQRLIVKDLSKFGTFLSGVRLKNAEEKEVSSGAEIQFGLQTGRFAFAWLLLASHLVTYEPMRVCLSGAGTGKERKEMEQLVPTAGCELVSEVEKATHLVIPEMTLTLKAVTALLTQKTIVSPKWLDQLVLRTDIASALPNADSYPPEVNDDNLRGASLVPDVRRATLFANCVFLFLTDAQFTKAARLVVGGGGKAEKFTVSGAQAAGREKKHIYIIRPSEKEKESKASVAKEAAHYGQPINETSLGYAILRVSTSVLIDPRKKGSSSPTKQDSSGVYLTSAAAATTPAKSSVPITAIASSSHSRGSKWALPPVMPPKPSANVKSTPGSTVPSMPTTAPPLPPLASTVLAPATPSPIPSAEVKATVSALPPVISPAAAPKAGAVRLLGPRKEDSATTPETKIDTPALTEAAAPVSAAASASEKRKGPEDAALSVTIQTSVKSADKLSDLFSSKRARAPSSSSTTSNVAAPALASASAFSHKRSAPLVEDDVIDVDLAKDLVVVTAPAKSRRILAESPIAPAVATTPVATSSNAKSALTLPPLPPMTPVAQTPVAQTPVSVTHNGTDASVAKSGASIATPLPSSPAAPADATPVVRPLETALPTNVKAFNKKRLSEAGAQVHCEPVNADAMLTSPVVEEARQALALERKEAKRATDLFVAQVAAKPIPKRKST